MTDKDIIIVTNKLHYTAVRLDDLIYTINEYLDIQSKYSYVIIDGLELTNTNDITNNIITKIKDEIDSLENACLSLWKNSEIYSKLYQVCKQGDRIETSLIWGWFENSSKTFQSFIKENYPNLIYNEKPYKYFV